MKPRTLIALLTLGLAAGAYATDATPARIALVEPGAARGVVNPNDYLKLVVEGGVVSHEKTPVPAEGLVNYVDRHLKATGATYLAVYVREGSRYGDVIRAIDTLRKTTAKDIGVSLVELEPGRDV